MVKSDRCGLSYVFSLGDSYSLTVRAMLESGTVETRMRCALHAWKGMVNGSNQKHHAAPFVTAGVAGQAGEHGVGVLRRCAGVGAQGPKVDSADPPTIPPPCQWPPHANAPPPPTRMKNHGPLCQWPHFRE